MRKLELPSIFSPLIRMTVSRISPSGSRAKLPIFIYHRVLDARDYMHPGEVTIDEFSWQIGLIAKYFNVIRLKEAIERLKQGSLPERCACITFDDGYADNYDNALPILKRWGLHATFFIATGFLDGGIMWNDAIIETVRKIEDHNFNLKKVGLGEYLLITPEHRQQVSNEIIKSLKHLSLEQRSHKVEEIVGSQSIELPDNIMMSRQQVVGMMSEGMGIGCHTVNHPILASIDKTLAEKEIQDGKDCLEEIVGEKMMLFAYPNGKPGKDYNSEHIEIVKKIGFKGAVSTALGSSNMNNDFYQLPRFCPWDKTPARFLLRMIRNYFSETEQVQC